MNSYDARPAALTAVAAGILAGALCAARRPRTVAQTALVPVDTVLHLPSPQPVVFETAPPVIYEARIETPSRHRRLPVIAGAIAICIALAFAFFEIARPQISAAGAPAIIDGSRAFISYSAAGNGSVDLTIDARFYHHTQRLPERQGVIELPATALRPGSDVLATFRMRGALGSDARVVRIQVLAKPHPLTRILPSTAPVVRSLALSATAAHGGDTIVARFDTNASSGALRLVDASGAIWTNQSVRGRGQAALQVPRMHADTPFIVTLQARRNGQTVTASAGFVARGTLETPAAPNTVVGTSRFTLPAIVRSGTTLSLTPPPGFTQAAVTLSAADGSALSIPFTERDGHVLMRVPSTTVPQTAFATLTYQRGKSKETLIRRVTVIP